MAEGREVDIHTGGLLWLINRCVFHPRGWALGHEPVSGRFFLYGDGREVWRYADDVDEQSLADAAAETLALTEETP